MRHLHKALGLLAAPLLCVPAGADIVVLEPSKDNTLYESATGALSNGVGDHIFSGVTAIGDLRRALLAFDVAASLPAGSTVNSAILQLNMSMTISGNHQVALHRATQDWGEGTSNAPGQEGAGDASTPGDATWIHTFFPGSTWTQAGGDFAGVASATSSVGGSGLYSWTTAALAADVQDMLDFPGGNFGWLVKHANEGGATTAKRFDSGEHFDTNARPKLRIDFTPPGGCSSASFCSSGPNSTSFPAMMTFAGSCVVADNALTLQAGPVPNQPGIFFYSLGQTNGGAGIPFGNGLRCVGSPGNPVYRLPVSFASGNLLSFTPDLTMPPSAAGQITAGSTWNFQAWFRDPAAGGAAFDLSDGLQIQFQ